MPRDRTGEGDPNRRIPPTKCRTCGALTAFSKPYCAKHIMRMPLAQKIREELEQRRTLPRFILADITDAAAAGPVSTHKLAVEFQMRLEKVLGYVFFLERRGSVRAVITNRGATFVELVP